MQLEQVEQRTEEWYKQRLGRATASSFAKIMGTPAARKTYMAQLLSERLTAEKEESYTSKAMEWGIENEDTARLMYSLTTGNDVEETGFWKHEKLEAGASPDGLVGEHGLLEIKCPNTATHIETLKKQSVPKQYHWQVQGQMWITGRQWCDFVSFDPRLPENAQMLIVHTERDDAAIEDLEHNVREFLKELTEEENFIKNYKA